MKSILVIDDSADFRQIVSEILLDKDFDVWEAECPDDAFKILKSERFDLIICDLHMPFTLGKEFASYPYSEEVGVRTIKELSWALPKTPIIAVSATMPCDLSRTMKDIQEIKALSKPFKASELLGAIKDSLEPVKGPLIH